MAYRSKIEGSKNYLERIVTVDEGEDASAPWVGGHDYTVGNEIFSFVPTQTTAKNFQGNNLVQGQTYFGQYAVPKVANGTLTIAELALIKTVAAPPQSLTDETAARIAADALNAKKADLVTSIRDVTTATDTNFPSEKAVAAALSSLPSNFLANTDTFNSFAGLALQVLRVNAATDAVEAIELAAALVAYDNATSNITGNPATTQAAIDALKALIDNQPQQTSVADFASLPDPATVQDGSIIHVIDASGDTNVTTGWAKYQEIGDVWFKYVAQEDFNVLAITPAQLLDVTDEIEGTVNSKKLFDREQARKGTGAETGGEEAIARDWDLTTLDELYAQNEIDVTAAGTTAEFGKAYRLTTETITLPVPSAANKGKEILLRNANDKLSATTLTVSGVDFKTNAIGGVQNVLRIVPSSLYTLRSNGSEYEFLIKSSPAVPNINVLTPDPKLIQTGEYTIDVPLAGLTVKLPSIVFGTIDVMIGQTSIGVLRLEIEDLSNKISYLDENGILRVNSFYEIDASKYKGRHIRIFADGQTGDWAFENLNESISPDVWTASMAYSTGSEVVAIAPNGVYAGKPRIYEANNDRPNTITDFDATEVLEWTDKGGAPLIENTRFFRYFPLSGFSVDSYNLDKNVAIIFSALGSNLSPSLKVTANTSGSKKVYLDGVEQSSPTDITNVTITGKKTVSVYRTYTDPAATSGATYIDTIVDDAVSQEVLPDWQAGQSYTVANTKVVGVAPANVEPSVEGTSYILRPKADLTSGANLDFTEWNLYDVVGQYELNGSTVRTVVATGIESLNFFDIKDGLEGNTRVIPEGVSKQFRLSGVADADFEFNDTTGGLVSSATGGTSQDFTIDGPAFLFHTLNGTTHQVSVFGSSVQTSELGETDFLIGEFYPTTGGIQNPTDQAGEIRGTGSTYDTGIDFNNVDYLVITYQERLNQRRQWHGIIDLKAQFTDGNLKGLHTAFDTWYVTVTATASQFAVGRLYFVETSAFNANLVSVRAYGKKQISTVVRSEDLTITNPNEADATKVLMPNGDGTATFQDAASGILETSLSIPYQIPGRKINNKQVWRVDFETACPAANAVVTVNALIPVGWDIIRGYSLQVVKSNTYRGFQWHSSAGGFRWDISQGTGNLNLRQDGNIVGSGAVVVGYFEYTRTDGL